MAVVVIMPKQGQSVESCIITTLHKKKGDIVKKGDVLFSYETDKASFEEESPADGTVLACFYGEGDEVPVLENMMIIGEPGEDITPLLTVSQEAASGSHPEETRNGVTPPDIQTGEPAADSSTATIVSTHNDKTLHEAPVQAGSPENRSFM